MSIRRVLRHLLSSGWQVRRTFSAACLEAIEQAIAHSERTHGGEIRFAFQASLDALELLRGVSPRERAIEVFAQLGVWDTEANNGVLIYVLWADHDVEILADRGFNGRVSREEWAGVCHRMERLFAAGEPQRAVTEGVAAVAELIRRHYPAADSNELPDGPVRV